MLDSGRGFRYSTHTGETERPEQTLLSLPLLTIQETKMTDTNTQSGVTANFDNTVDSKDFTFHFKKDKLGNKRPSVELECEVFGSNCVVEVSCNAGLCVCICHFGFLYG